MKKISRYLIIALIVLAFPLYLVSAGWNPYISYVDTALDPTKVPGCIFWVRSDLGAWQDAAKTIPCVADSLVYTGANQAASGSENDAIQATESKRFIYKENILNGCPSWRADGTGSFMEVFGSLVNMLDGTNKPFSVFIVAKPHTIDSDMGAFNWTGGGLWHTLIFTGTAEKRIKWCIPTTEIAGGITQTDPLYSITANSGTVANMWKNGLHIPHDANSTPSQAFGWNRFLIGSRENVQPIYYDGDYFEIAIYNREINTTEVALLADYANERYRLPTLESWTPYEIATFDYWMRSDQVLKDGSDKVYRWPNLGDNYLRDFLNTAGDPTSYPTWVANQLDGYPILSFDDSADYLQGSFAHNQPDTFFVVFKIDTIKDGYDMFDGDPNTHRCLLYSGSDIGLCLYSNAWVPNAGARFVPGIINYMIIKIVFNGTSSRYQVDNDIIYTSNNDANANSTILRLGKGAGGFPFKIVEKMRFTSDLSDANSTTIYNYLKARYPSTGI